MAGSLYSLGERQMLQDFLSRLQKVKKSGGKYTARCPSHDDKENSLGITEGNDGRILLKCYAGCATDQICGALGMTVKDLFPASKTAKRGAKTIDVTYDYVDAAGTVVYQVVRYIPKDFRQRRPDGNGGWIWNLEGVERVLYNLPKVLDAIAAGKTIFLVEGEKDVHSLAKLGLTGTTNAGGAAKWSKKYTEILRQAKWVVILPDNDEAGREHARRVVLDLPTALVVELPGLPVKGDVTDWVNAGGTAEALKELAFQAMHARATAPATPLPPPKQEHRHYRALGYNTGRFFFLPERSQQVLPLAPAALGVKANIFSIAPLAHWETNPDFCAEGKVDYAAVADSLIRQCYEAGIYREDFLRGRGAWWDDGRIVLHLGNRLVVDGRNIPLMEHTTGYVYQRGLPLEMPHEAPLHREDSNRLYQLCQQLSWESPVAANLLAGWIALAPICGVLKWRPHIWITGSAGTGKSWTMSNIVAGILRNISLMIQSSSTEAGIRQMLKQDALPVLFDEADTDDQRGQYNIQKVLELARQASSEGGSKIAKGTAHGDAVVFDIRSMFCMASIGISVKRRADETRVTVLSLKQPLGGKAGAERFAELERLAAEVCTSEFAAGLIARSCSMAKIIRKNADTFAIAAGQSLGSRRVGDQIGTLLAGAWSLWSDDEITLEDALKYVRAFSFDDLLPADDSRDETRCMAFLLEQRIRLEVQGKTLGDRTVAELIGYAMYPTGAEEAALAGVAEATLRRYGIRTEPAGLVVSNTHSAIADMLSSTPWSVGWSVFLKRLPGVTALGKTVKFSGTPSKAVCIPWDQIFPPERREPGEDDDVDEETEAPHVAGQDDIPF